MRPATERSAPLSHSATPLPVAACRAPSPPLTNAHPIWTAAARLALTHDRRIPEPFNELERRRLAAYRRSLARPGGARLA